MGNVQTALQSPKLNLPPNPPGMTPQLITQTPASPHHCVPTCLQGPDSDTLPLRVDKFHIMCKGCRNEVSDPSQEVTPMPTWQPVALRNGEGRTFESLPASLASALCSDVEAIPTEGQPLRWLHSGCRGRSFQKVTQYAVSPGVMVACFGTRQQFDTVTRKVGSPAWQGLSCLVAA